MCTTAPYLMITSLSETLGNLIVSHRVIIFHILTVMIQQESHDLCIHDHKLLGEFDCLVAAKEDGCITKLYPGEYYFNCLKAMLYRSLGNVNFSVSVCETDAATKVFAQ